MTGRSKGWLQLAIWSLGLGALVWFLPSQINEPDPLGRKARGFVFFYNLIAGPLLDGIGRVPLVGGFAVLTLVGLIGWIGFRVPQVRVPKFTMPERKAREEQTHFDPTVPMQRRRGLGQMASGAENEAAAPPFSATELINQTIEHGYLETLARHTGKPIAELEAQQTELNARLAQKAERIQNEHCDPIAITRQRRLRGQDWSNARSWFGGLPKLGDQAWPRGKKGQPLPFVCQLDLAELAEVNPDTPLPKQGSLAFFMGTGAVIAVTGTGHATTSPPPDLPPAYEECGYPDPQQQSRFVQPLFPYWPIEPLRMRLPPDLPHFSEDEEVHEEIYEAQREALSKLVEPREYSFSVYSAEKAGVASAGKLWWRGARHVLDGLLDAADSYESVLAQIAESISKSEVYQQSLLPKSISEEERRKEMDRSLAYVETCRQRIPKVDAQKAQLDELVYHFSAFVKGRSDWQEMTAEEIEVLKQVLHQARFECDELCRYRVPVNIRNLQDLCIRRMMTGDAEAFAALPDDMLEFVNRHYRGTSQFGHQMFGLGGCKQTALYEHLNDHLLLQIDYDEMIEMQLGDMGICQFWISPEDLAAGNFERTKVTFECA